MIHLHKRTWQIITEKLIFFAPVLIVIIIASFLVYCTYLADISLTAVVVAEEGTGTEAASAGLVNALTFILPAIIGGFLIALLFKYRKKLTLKYFFAGALFFAGLFISFFFGDSILFLIQSRYYNLHILNYDPMNLKLFNFSILFTFSGIYLILIVCCGALSFAITYVISSRKFGTSTKNSALLVQSALMGAFLSVILPTYTVIILLIGLSIYDIYSVRRGPIRDIVKYTIDDEANNYQSMGYHQIPPNAPKAHQKSPPMGIIVASKVSINNGSDQASETSTRKYILVKQESVDDSDSIITNMTYSSQDWDIGIGDLVFYSLLASQPLTPYFIFNHGGHLMATFGPWIFWLISLFTIIGILIGFVFTIRLLERNSMLPGLPFSIALGLTGFLGSAFILSLF
ncbi:hypothetical protein [[Eubacterium] cellulosolvens]